MFSWSMATFLYNKSQNGTTRFVLLEVVQYNMQGRHVANTGKYSNELSANRLALDTLLSPYEDAYLVFLVSESRIIDMYLN